jgi:hypothetical protein
MVKLSGVAAIMLFFTSCHNEVPELPTVSEVEGYKYCKYEDNEGIQCKSTYEISEESCESEVVGGELFSDAAACEDAL